MARVSEWRERARAVIRQVIVDNPDANDAEFKKLLSAAYPFGKRESHPYKIWLNECKRARQIPVVKDRSIRHYWGECER